MTEQRFEVQHRSEESRYVLIDRGADGTDSNAIGEEAYVDVVTGEATHRVMYHTHVSEEYGGQGLASVLVRYAVEHTIAAGLTISPVCPYVVKWLEKHSDYAAHVIKAGPEHLRAVREQQR